MDEKGGGGVFHIQYKCPSYRIGLLLDGASQHMCDVRQFKSIADMCSLDRRDIAERIDTCQVSYQYSLLQYWSLPLYLYKVVPIQIWFDCSSEQTTIFSCGPSSADKLLVLCQAYRGNLVQKIGLIQANKVQPNKILDGKSVLLPESVNKLSQLNDLQI